MQDTKKLRLVVGSYTVSLPHVQAKGAGISFVDLDPATGTFTLVNSHPDFSNPSYLAQDASRGLLYAVEELAAEDGSSIVTMTIDPSTAILRPLSKVPAHGDWPCHIGFDHARKRLFVSNYLSGSFVTWPLDENGLPSGTAQVIQRSGTGPNADRQEGPHAHFAAPTPDGRHVLVCDAGTDEIALYALDSQQGVGSAPDLVLSAPPGALPRHLDIATDKKRLFVVSELGNIVSTWTLDQGAPQLLGHVSTLPQDFSGASASSAIRCHPNGRYLYSANRGHDSIAIFDITGEDGLPRLIANVPCGGQTPREMALSPAGDLLIVANQDSHTLASFAVDQSTGALCQLGESYAIGSPVSVLFTA